MPLLKKLRSALTRGLPSAPPATNAGEPSPEQLEVLRRAEEALRTVIIPGYDVDLVGSGVVKRLRLTRDGRLLVFLDYTGSDPHCNFCRFINWQLWKKILAQAEEALGKYNLPPATFIDWATGAKIEYK